MNITQERADFEAFASKHGLCVTGEGDLYRSHVVAWMWKAWQARAALQSQDHPNRQGRVMDKLFCDMKTDEEKAAFFLSGRGYETGVISHSIQNDVAMAYQRCAEYRKELEALQSQDREDGFSDGVLLALQLMTDAGDAGSHLHFELIKTAGLEKIVRRALQEGMWELAGLDAPMSESAREAIDHARRIEENK